MKTNVIHAHFRGAAGRLEELYYKVRKLLDLLSKFYPVTVHHHTEFIKGNLSTYCMQCGLNGYNLTQEDHHLLGVYAILFLAKI